MPGGLAGSRLLLKNGKASTQGPKGPRFGGPRFAGFGFALFYTAHEFRYFCDIVVPPFLHCHSVWDAVSVIAHFDNPQFDVFVLAVAVIVEFSLSVVDAIWNALRRNPDDDGPGPGLAPA